MQSRAPDEGPSGERPPASEDATKAIILDSDVKERHDSHLLQAALLKMRPRAHDESSGGERPAATEVAISPIKRESDVEERYDPKLLRAVVRKWNIDTTKSLVATYNSTTDKDEQAVLLGWLRRYNVRKEECMRPSTISEYAELAKMKPRTKKDEMLLRTLVVDVCSLVPDNACIGGNVAKALLDALVSVDLSVFKSPAPLVVLARNLLSRVSPGLRIDKDNFAEHETTFLTLHRVFESLHRVARHKMTERERADFRRTIREKRKTLKDSLNYYPICFHIKLIEQSIERLEPEDSMSGLTQAIQCVSFGICGVLRTFHFLRRLATLDFDLTAIEQTVRKLKELVSSVGVSDRRWYDVLQTLMATRLQALKDNAKLELFMSGCDVAMEYQRKLRPGEDLKAIRFGIIKELSELASHAVFKNVRDEATMKLTELATDRALHEGWLRDADLLKVLLDILHELHMSGEQIEKTTEALRRMQQSCRDHAKETLKEWLAGSTMEEKLRMKNRSEQNVEAKDLCINIGREVGYVPLATMHSNIEDLKERYRHDNFAMVASLFEKDPRRHVKDMKHHVVMYEEVIEKKHRKAREEIEEKEKEEEGSSKTKKDHASEYYEQKTRVKTPIALNELFKPRSLKQGVAPSEIRKVLLYGNPGSGKTCLSKVIAHKWASGEMAQEFKAVYIVPVRTLNEAKSRGPEWATLESAISRICFSKRRHIECKDLSSQVDNDLDLSTTLLMLDGLDEANVNIRELISDAEKRSCKILMLTRPYNLEDIENRVDIEVECLGFNDEQLREFIMSELLPENAQQLIQSLQETPAMWEMAHIPVTANILCSLSIAQRTPIKEEKKKSSMFQIYKDMTNYVWKRFKERVATTLVKKTELFMDLEKIAFEAIRNGQILIDERSVLDLATFTDSAAIFKESGFLLLVLEGKEYQFPHLTFQEYFAGWYIARSLQNKESREFQRVNKFLQKRKYLQKHSVTMSFAMHAFAEIQEETGLQQMLKIMDEEPVELFGLQHFFLRIQILETALAEANKEAREVLRRDAKAKALMNGIKQLVRAATNDEILRQEVVEHMEQCPNIFETFPQVLDEIIKQMKQMVTKEARMSSKEHDKLRDATKLAKHSSKHLLLLVESLREISESTSVEKRMEAIEVAQILSEEANLQAENALSVLAKCCVDKDEEVCKNALAAIGRVAASAPSLAMDALDSLVKCCSDEYSSVRSYVAEAIGKVAAASPSIAAAALEPLLMWCADEHWRVRLSAAEAIGKVAATAPSTVADVLAPLMRCCLDEHPSVRSYAAEAIGSVAVVAPSLAADLLAPLVKCYEHDDWSAGIKAAQAIGKVAVAAPDIAIDALEPLVKWSADEQ